MYSPVKKLAISVVVRLEVAVLLAVIVLPWLMLDSYKVLASDSRVVAIDEPLMSLAVSVVVELSVAVPLLESDW